MNFVEGGVEAQAQQALANLKAVLEASGSEMGKVAKVTVRLRSTVELERMVLIRESKVFMKDMNDFVAVNKIYEQAFGEHKPARYVSILVYRNTLIYQRCSGLLSRSRACRKTRWWRLRPSPSRE